jgi:hypothetical protein
MAANRKPFTTNTAEMTLAIFLDLCTQKNRALGDLGA